MAARKKKKTPKKQKTKKQKAKKAVKAARGKTARKTRAASKAGSPKKKKKAAKAKPARAGKAAAKKKAPKKKTSSRKAGTGSASKSSVTPKAPVQAKPVQPAAPKPEKKKAPPKAAAPKVVAVATEPVAPKPVATAPVATKPVATKAADPSKYYITTAISYPNGVPHIGHAYEAIATDALARFQRLDGKDVFFLTGTDEHGLKMVQTAARENLSVREFADRNAGRFKAMDERLNVSFNRFIRTTEEEHHRSSKAIWNRMQQNGDIYVDTYSGWYSVRDEAYYAEEETTVGDDGVRRGPQGTPV